MPLERRDVWAITAFVLCVLLYVLVFYLSPPPLREFMHDVKP